MTDKEKHILMTDKKKQILFTVYSYGIFWVYLLFSVCLILTGILDAGGLAHQIITVFGSWSPTIALLILYKKLFPGSTVKDFYKKAFKTHLDVGLIVGATTVYVAIYICAAYIVSLTRAVPFASLFDLSLKTIGMGIFWSAIQGATGEESGWRGFLQPSLEKKHGVLKAGLIVGVIWSFWHMPLWFLTGFSGMDLIKYILAYIVAVTSLTVIMGVCHKHCRNLFVPVWLHFLFNFGLSLYTGDNLTLVICLAGCYVIAAAGYSVWHVRRKQGVTEIEND